MSDLVGILKTSFLLLSSTVNCVRADKKEMTFHHYRY